MDQEFDLHSIVSLLRRHLRLIIGTTFIVVAIAGVTVVMLKPIYSASTLVLVDPSRKNLLDPSDTTVSAASDSARVDSEVELVKSEQTLLRTAQELNLVQTAEYGPQLSLQDKVLAILRIADPQLPSGDEALQIIVNRLRSSVSVSRRGLTYLIEVQARSEDPQLAARIANSIAAAYIQQQLEAKIASTTAARDIIQARIADAQSAVAQSEQSFDAFIANNLQQISSETGRTDLLGLQRQLDALNVQRAQQAQMEQLASASLAQRDWNQVAESLKSEAVANLERQRNALQASLSGATEGSPQAVNLREELTKIETQLGATARAELTSMHDKIAEAQVQSAQLKEQLRTSVLNADLPANILTSMYGLQQSAEIARNQYQTLLARQHDLDAQAYLQVADSRVATEAVPPTDPAFPNKRLILLLAGLFGLGLGTSLAFLLENYVGGFTSQDQVDSVLRVKIAAVVPRERSSGVKNSVSRSLADNLVTAPLAPFAEAIRRARVALDQMRGRQQADKSARGTVIMVSSSSPNEGKTTMALSLARAYALSGRSTLLLDCDLRKPGLHRQMSVEPSSALLDLLMKSDESDVQTLSTTIIADAASGAQVIVGSRHGDAPTDQLLAGRSFARLIEAARKSFDIVILDTPPIGPVVDGLYLASFADAILFVIRWAKTSQQEARNAIAALSEAKQPNVEIVALLNQAETSRRGYYSYRYSGYYAQ